MLLRFLRTHLLCLSVGLPDKISLRLSLPSGVTTPGVRCVIDVGVHRRIGVCAGAGENVRLLAA